jgi:hypothetical protein
MQVAQRASEEIKKRHLPFYGLVLWHPGFPDLEFLLFLKFLILNHHDIICNKIYRSYSKA